MIETAIKEIRFERAFEEEGRRIIAGYASVEIKDDYGTIITTEALRDALPKYMENPVLRYQHQPEPIGKVLWEYKTKDGEVLQTHVDENGLFIVAEIINDPAATRANEVWALIRAGIISGFSVGGQILQTERGIDATYITRIKLFEISVVDLPANEKSHFKIYRNENPEDLKRPFGHWPDFESCVREIMQEGYDEESARKICGYLEQKLKKEKEEGNMQRDGEMGKKIEEWLSRKKYPWDQCIRDMKKEGYSDEAAARICAAIKNRTVRHMVEFGLAEDLQDAYEKLAKKIEEDKIFGYVIQRLKELTLQLMEQDNINISEAHKGNIEGGKMSEMERQEAAPVNQPEAPAPEKPAIEERVTALETEVAEVKNALSQVLQKLADIEAMMSQHEATEETPPTEAEVAAGVMTERKGAVKEDVGENPKELSREARINLLRQYEEIRRV